MQDFDVVGLAQVEAAEARHLIGIGVKLVSSVGTHRDERSQLYFKNGFLEMLKRINPDVVILYGDSGKDAYPWLPNMLEVVYVIPDRFKRARSHG